MAEGSAIQWCDDTVNPTMGCDGCELWRGERKTCYAGVLHEMRGRTNPGYSPRFEIVSLRPGRLRAAARRPDLRDRIRPIKPWLDGSPRLIFVSDMSDALSKDVPFEYLEREIIDEVESAAGQRHRWLWLTKRPRRMAKFSRWLAALGRRWPANVWAGASVTTSNTKRIDPLLEVGDENTIRFLSVEPQYVETDLPNAVEQVDWVLQGGESGARARRFDLAWARRLRDQCRDAGTPYFLKQVGAKPVDAGKLLKLHDAHGGNWSEWPLDLRVRQVPRIGAHRREIDRKLEAADNAPSFGNDPRS